MPQDLRKLALDMMQQRLIPRLSGRCDEVVKGDGTCGTPEAGPAGAVTSVNGQTGAVQLELFDGTWASLAGKPTLFSGAYPDLTNKPALFSGAYADLTGKPTLFDGAYSSLTGRPTLGTAAATDATAYATAAQGAKADTALQVLGYTAGGGAVVQATNKTTGVTINARCGKITMSAAALAAAAEVSFVVTNNTVAATDVVVACVQSVGTAGAYFVTVGAVADGSFRVTVGNASTGSLSQAVVLNFVVIKAVAA